MNHTRSALPTRMCKRELTNLPTPLQRSRCLSSLPAPAQRRTGRRLQPKDITVTREAGQQGAPHFLGGSIWGDGVAGPSQD